MVMDSLISPMINLLILARVNFHSVHTYVRSNKFRVSFSPLLYRYAASFMISKEGKRFTLRKTKGKTHAVRINELLNCVVFLSLNSINSKIRNGTSVLGTLESRKSPSTRDHHSRYVRHDVVAGCDVLMLLVDSLISNPF